MHHTVTAYKIPFYNPSYKRRCAAFDKLYCKIVGEYECAVVRCLHWAVNCVQLSPRNATANIISNVISLMCTVYSKINQSMHRLPIRSMHRSPFEKARSCPPTIWWCTIFSAKIFGVPELEQYHILCRSKNCAIRQICYNCQIWNRSIFTFKAYSTDGWITH